MPDGRSSRDETFAALLAALGRPEPDADAWPKLEEMAREDYGAGAAPFLAASLSQALRTRADEPDAAVFTAIAGVVAGSPLAPRLVVLLAAEPDTTARSLALALVARLSGRLRRSDLKPLRPLLSDRRLPGDLTFDAVVALLSTFGRDGPLAPHILRAWTARLGKVKAVERLRHLAERVGPSPAIDQLSGHLEDRQRMSCPRCSAQLRRREMVRHLWQEHNLLLDGRRVREPWQLVEDWLGEHRQQRDDELLARCRALAVRVDPQQGLLRVQRLFLAHGVDDAAARRVHFALARERQASLCPHCYALAPLPEERPVRPLNVWRGRLTIPGYRVEVSEKGLLTGLTIETPAGVLYRGTEPGQLLTYHGVTALLAGPPVLAALLLALWLPAGSVWPIPLVLLLLAAALAVHAKVCRRWRIGVAPLDRAIDYAWTLLVPHLHADGFSADDSAFLAGLALTSIDHGHAVIRDSLRERLRQVTEKAAAAGAGAARHLAALRRLALFDAVRSGQDPVPLIAGEVGRCFEGQVPLAFAEEFLADRRQPWWSGGHRGRLRVLLCDRAFEAGLEVRDLLEVGRVSPSLGVLIATDDAGGLARLRLLWSMRPRQPWDRCGEAVTVFELAATAGGRKLLAQHPDLLLRQEVPLPPEVEVPTDEKAVWAEVLLCGRGVVFEEALFTAPPPSIEVIEKGLIFRGGYELVVGETRFRFDHDPEPLALRLERWFRFHFGEFLPQTADVFDWQSPGVAPTLRALEAVACPECRRLLFPRRGEVGVAV